MGLIDARYAVVRLSKCALICVGRKQWNGLLISARLSIKPRTYKVDQVDFARAWHCQLRTKQLKVCLLIEPSK